MQRDRWLRVKEIVNASLELEVERRESFIADACRGNQTLLSEVSSLLESYGGLGDFLANSVLEDNRDDLLAGIRVGLYEIREPIAAGGMGTVYRAVRANDFQKQVAVKVVKRGMDTNFILRRFREERQILAALDHPNIARLLDGGATADGRPYLVMEYIEGRPITQYAREQGLKLSERLQLFRTVCSAVQYAHQNLVVHRDLKAGNILVTAGGTPKLLDFGIAKLVESDTDITATALRLMTPECASPEQVRGETITTATDIYSLGILLYELLSDRPPYQFKTRTPDEVRRLVCETQPLKPSSIRRLPEELDNVVLKAIDKEPTRRYVSVEQFAEDLRRFLHGLPVMARGNSAWYRARKFAARHKAATVAAAAVAISLVGGMGATLWEAKQAQTERARAERRFNDLRELSDSLIFEVHDAIRTLPGSTAARKLIVDRALKYLDRLTQETRGDDQLRRELAMAYLRLGQVQGQAGSSNLGDEQAAIGSLRRAITLFEQLQASGRLNAAAERALAGGYDTLSTALWDAGDRKAAEDCDRKALALRQDLTRNLPQLQATDELSLSYHALGLHRAEAGDFPAALENYQKFLDARERIARAEPRSPANQRQLSLAHKRVGAVLIKTGKLSDALDHYRMAQAIDESRVRADPGNAEARMDLTFAYSDIGFIQREQGHWRAALAQYQKAEAIRGELAAADPHDERARASLATTCEFIAAILHHSGERDNSLRYYRKALALREALLARNPTNSGRRAAVASANLNVGDAYADLATRSRMPAGHRMSLWREARDHYQKALLLTAALKAAGALRDDGAETDRQAVRQLRLCDAAIGQLTGAVAPSTVSANLAR